MYYAAYLGQFFFPHLDGPYALEEEVIEFFQRDLRGPGMVLAARGKELHPVATVEADGTICTWRPA
jgi:hypothetical protein